ncbi:MAG: hypothetical protein HZB51_32100 [Chloroflexi bacterium]|nr:hypothetical protein [Chloroflexota bacterium]
MPARFISESDVQEPTTRQIAVLDSLDKLTADLMPQLIEWAQRDLQTCLSNWGITLDELGIEIDLNNLQNHFSIAEILIPRLGDCKTDYVFLAGECDWDSDHGIEFLLKNGIPILCEAQEGLAMNESWDDYLKT